MKNYASYDREKQIINDLGEACQAFTKKVEENQKLIDENLYLKGRVDGLELAMRLLGKYSLVGAASAIGAEVSGKSKNDDVRHRCATG